MGSQTGRGHDGVREYRVTPRVATIIVIAAVMAVILIPGAFMYLLMYDPFRGWTFP
jgi:hypothetical protein